jgi:opacity protein-like surface antigen
MHRNFLAVSLVLAGVAGEARAEVLFRGIIETVSASAECAGIRNVGALDSVQYHPRNLGNDNFAALTTIWSFGGHSYSLSGADFGLNFTQVETGGLGWSVYNSNKKASVLFDPVPDIDAQTKFLALKGKIKNPNGNEGEEQCVIGFRAALYKEVQ